MHDPRARGPHGGRQLRLYFVEVYLYFVEVCWCGGRTARGAAPPHPRKSASLKCTTLDRYYASPAPRACWPAAPASVCIRPTPPLRLRSRRGGTSSSPPAPKTCPASACRRSGSSIKCPSTRGLSIFPAVRLFPRRHFDLCSNLTARASR